MPDAERVRERRRELRRAAADGPECEHAHVVAGDLLVGHDRGTMNNVIFGASRFGYYEPVCGGAGAACIPTSGP